MWVTHACPRVELWFWTLVCTSLQVSTDPRVTVTIRPIPLLHSVWSRYGKTKTQSLLSKCEVFTTVYSIAHICEHLPRFYPETPGFHWHTGGMMLSLWYLKHSWGNAKCFVFFKSAFENFAFLGCPPHWKNFTDKCYYFSVEKEIFEDAKLFCEDKSSHLVFINSREEQVWYVSCTLGWRKL